MPLHGVDVGLGIGTFFEAEISDGEILRKSGEMRQQLTHGDFAAKCIEIGVIEIDRRVGIGDELGNKSCDWLIECEQTIFDA